MLIVNVTLLLVSGSLTLLVQRWMASRSGRAELRPRAPSARSSGDSTGSAKLDQGAGSGRCSS